MKEKWQELNDRALENMARWHLRPGQMSSAFAESRSLYMTLLNHLIAEALRKGNNC